MIEKELRHKFRYHVQSVYLPELVESVSEGYLPSIALFPSAQWYYDLRQYYDIKELKAVGVYERFERIDVDENHMLILYVFPQPQEMTEAVYGAVILNTVTSEAEYYTLESSVDDRWVIGHKTTSCHSNLGFLDRADHDKFVAWVIERAGQKKYSLYVFEGTRRYQFNTINGKKGGRKWEIVTLRNLETGELKGFKSKSECSRWLRDEFGFSTREFNKFMKGQGKICDKFILMD